MQLRIMNEVGSDEFRNYIVDVKRGVFRSIPDLNTDRYSYEYYTKCEVSDNLNGIETRLELAKYLDKQFSANSIERASIIGDPGIWTWIAYHWLDFLSPERNGIRRFKEYYSYVYIPSYRRSYRHLIAAAYLLYTALGEAESRLFLECNIDEHNDYVEQLASSGYIISNHSIIRAAHTLYWDYSKNRPKRGGQTRHKPGTLRRFTSVLSQLEMNYDIFSADENDILNLLPSEFDKWKS